MCLTKIKRKKVSFKCVCEFFSPFDTIRILRNVYKLKNKKLTVLQKCIHDHMQPRRRSKTFHQETWSILMCTSSSSSSSEALLLLLLLYLDIYFYKFNFLSSSLIQKWGPSASISCVCSVWSSRRDHLMKKSHYY